MRVFADATIAGCNGKQSERICDDIVGYDLNGRFIGIRLPKEIDALAIIAANKQGPPPHKDGRTPGRSVKSLSVDDQVGNRRQLFRRRFRMRAFLRTGTLPLRKDAAVEVVRASWESSNRLPF